jgi:hypothetical protein
MNIDKHSRKVLLGTLLLNLISTWLHYTDNALFLDRYPGPEWFTTWGVFGTVILMTPIGLLGYWLYIKDRFWSAYFCLALYSITSVSSPGHYIFPMVMPMSLKMHALIWLDAISGLLLLGFLFWSSMVAQEWQSGNSHQKVQ